MMEHESQINQASGQGDNPSYSRRHPVTLEHSPEETIKRMRSLPERAGNLKEALRALREAHSR